MTIDFSLIPFGFNSADETFVDVRDVPRGAKCGCICPSCKTPLIAKQGEKKEWHFAHASQKVYQRTQKECEYSFYLSVRMMARQMIGDKLNIRLPEYKDVVSKVASLSGHSLHEPFWITTSKEICLSDVEVEAIFEGVPVDIVGYINDFRFVVYFTHPGRDVPQELKSPGDHHSGVIAVALDELRGTIFRRAKEKDQSYLSILTEHLSNDLSSKHWVYHPRYQSCRQKALEQLDVKIALSRAKNTRPQYFGIPVSHRLKMDVLPQNITGPLVTFECLMCDARWQCREPGGSVCPECNAHLCSRQIKIPKEDEGTV